jgi:uncharacterized membrane protein
MAFCNLCGAQIADGTTTCATCAARMSAAAAAPAGAGAPAAASASVGGLTDNVAGLLAYITIIPAIIFLVMEPYNKNRFVRFHSFQSIFFFAAVFVIHIVLSMMTVIPFMIFLTAPLHLLVFLGTILMIILFAIKANGGQMWKFPVIGDLAEKQANAM